MTEENRRKHSIDLFRGITIAGMIIVNNQGNWSQVFPPLRHAAWHGVTPADLVFPFFLFIMGVSLSQSIIMTHKGGAAITSPYKKIITRASLLLLFGLALNVPLDLDFSTMRFPGVLQRIALCYFFTSLIARRKKTCLTIVAAVLLPALYWTMMLVIPVPGFSAGDISPEGNLCRFIDASLLGSHTYAHAPARGFDPEGILSTIPAVSTSLMGLLAGSIILKPENRRIKPVALSFLSGIAIAAAGIALHPWIPLNKNLWSPSYVLFSGGTALMIFTLCRCSMDLEKAARFVTPFLSLGRNPLAVYVASSAFARLTIVPVWTIGGTTVSTKQFIYDAVFGERGATPTASLFYALLYLAACTIAAEILRRRRIIIKI